MQEYVRIVGVIKMEAEDKVKCDENCGALENPVTFEEYKKSYEHWTEHRMFSGCAHGC